MHYLRKTIAILVLLLAMNPAWLQPIPSAYALASPAQAKSGAKKPTTTGRAQAKPSAKKPPTKAKGKPKPHVNKKALHAAIKKLQEAKRLVTKAHCPPAVRAEAFNGINQAIASLQRALR